MKNYTMTHDAQTWTTQKNDRESEAWGESPFVSLPTH